jgi:uncharacterized protein (DUF362 family)
MDRRHFLKALAAGAVGAHYLGPDDLLALAGDAPPALAAVTGADPARATTEAIAALGGMSRFVSRGDVVVVKPNISWDRAPELAANTNPAVVATVIRLAYEAGAKTVRVFDNSCNTDRRCYARSGIADAARAAGAEVSFVEERNFARMDLEGEKLREWPVHRDVVEADKLINVPVAKHHSLARLTLSMKNLMGLIGGRRNLLHQQIDVNLVDLTAFFRPTLNVLDGTRILTAGGPQGGSLEDVKVLDTVAASVDPVAIDAYGATWFGMSGEDLGCVRVAHERGLGEKALDRLAIVEKRLS